MTIHCGIISSPMRVTLVSTATLFSVSPQGDKGEPSTAAQGLKGEPGLPGLPGLMGMKVRGSTKAYFFYIMDTHILMYDTCMMLPRLNDQKFIKITVCNTSYRVTKVTRERR